MYLVSTLCVMHYPNMIETWFTLCYV